MIPNFKSQRRSMIGIPWTKLSRKIGEKLRGAKIVETTQTSFTWLGTSALCAAEVAEHESEIAYKLYVRPSLEYGHHNFQSEIYNKIEIARPKPMKTASQENSVDDYADVKDSYEFSPQINPIVFFERSFHCK